MVKLTLKNQRRQQFKSICNTMERKNIGILCPEQF
jgi:hypothetical protein